MEPTARELAAPAPDARVVALSEVYPRHEARLPGVAPRAWDLGRVGIDPHRHGEREDDFSPIEWLDLTGNWVAGDLRPEVIAPFARWEASMAKRATWRGHSSLLERRADRLFVAPPADGGFQLQCAHDARGYAVAVADAAEREASYEAASLVAILEARSDPSAGERLLLGYLLAQRASWRDEPTPLARSLSLFTSVGRDEKAHPEVRAHAEYQAAHIHCIPSRSEEEACVAALKRVVALTKDRELELDALYQQIDVTRDDDARHKLLEHIFATLPHRQGDWRVSRALRALAEERYRRGELEGALDVAAACGRLEAAGCMDVFVRALWARGGAPEGMSVPLPFIGPLALALMEHSRGVIDHDEARRAGELLLARFPEARETPRVLELLASNTRDRRAHDALLERRARVVAPDSAWSLAQRAGRSPDDDVQGLELAVGRLLSPPLQYPPERPENDDELRDELRRRAQSLARHCTNELTTAARELHLSIDTTPAVPRLRASGASGQDVDCLSRAVSRYFRSVGEATIDVTLFVDYPHF
jgi:hypothetical protein